MAPAYPSIDDLVAQLDVVPYPFVFAQAMEAPAVDLSSDDRMVRADMGQYLADFAQATAEREASRARTEQVASRTSTAATVTRTRTDSAAAAVEANPPYAPCPRPSSLTDSDNGMEWIAANLATRIDPDLVAPPKAAEAVPADEAAAADEAAPAQPPLTLDEAVPEDEAAPAPPPLTPLVGGGGGGEVDYGHDDVGVNDGHEDDVGDDGGDDGGGGGGGRDGGGGGGDDASYGDGAGSGAQFPRKQLPKRWQAPLGPSPVASQGSNGCAARQRLHRYDVRRDFFRCIDAVHAMAGGYDAVRIAIKAGTVASTIAMDAWNAGDKGAELHNPTAAAAVITRLRSQLSAEGTKHWDLAVTGVLKAVEAAAHKPASSMARIAADAYVTEFKQRLGGSLG